MSLRAHAAPVAAGLALLLALAVVPAASGLPLSVTLVGRPGDESTLLSLAGQIEAERPWADRRPPGF